jgi:hypothetical protein
MGRIAFIALAILAGLAGECALAQSIDDALRIYAVKVVKGPPVEHEITGYGIYLGRGLIITAAHVVGHWPALTNPTVRINGRDLPTRLLKEGSFETIDLALLSVDEAQLSASLRLRRNPLCKDPPHVGEEVVDVLPDQTSRTRVISPLSISPQMRVRFPTLMEKPEQSGSGLFDANKKCLRGIVSAKLPKFIYKSINGVLIAKPSGFAGYFVPANEIAAFIPADLHF